MDFTTAYLMHLDAIAAYEDKFGKGSLENTPYIFDPLYATVADFKRASKIYHYMVKRGWKFKQSKNEIINVIY